MLLTIYASLNRDDQKKNSLVKCTIKWKQIKNNSRLFRYIQLMISQTILYLLFLTYNNNEKNNKKCAYADLINIPFSIFPDNAIAGRIGNGVTTNSIQIVIVAISILTRQQIIRLKIIGKHNHWFFNISGSSHEYYCASVGMCWTGGVRNFMHFKYVFHVLKSRRNDFVFVSLKIMHKFSNLKHN